MRTFKFAICLFVGFVLLNLSSTASISPEAGAPTRYLGGLMLGGDTREDRCEFAIEIEKVTFALNSVQNKYKVIRLRVENFSKTPMVLSAEKDNIELQLEGNVIVKGILNLRKADSPFWDSLDVEMRETLAYPQTIDPAKASTEGNRGKTTPLYVFILFPKDKVLKLPRSFSYRIDSLDKVCEIPLRAPALR